MTTAMTYADLFREAAIRKLVESETLFHEGDHLRGSDGMSRAEFMELPVDERVQQVMKDVDANAAWKPALRVEIPKGNGKEGTRGISYATVLDSLRLKLLSDWLRNYAETVLSPVAVGYRQGMVMSGTIRGAVRSMRARKLYMVSVTDVRGFFDNVGWRHLDRVIERLPGDDEIKRCLRAAVRIEVHDRHEGVRIPRAAGTPQGLATSPVLANLVLTERDRALGRYVHPRGGVVLRYADDFLIAMGTVEEATAAQRILARELADLGLSIKEGTGDVVDLRAHTEGVRWLGVELRVVHGVLATRVPHGTIAGKAEELRAKLLTGVLSPEGVEDALERLYRYFTHLTRKEEARRAIKSIEESVIDVASLRRAVYRNPRRQNRA